ncbi:MAG: hypothetical protein GXP63_02610 [DPANN group archaeon]|nr:hypothetical protein [DPANN group archaeon]
MASRLRLGRRGVAFEFTWWIINLMVLVIVFVLANAAIVWFANISLHDQPAKAATLINRIYFSPHGFTYDDGLSSHPGIVDPLYFTDRRLAQAINFTHPNKIIAAKITLHAAGSRASPERKDYVPPIYLNRRWYDRWDVLAGFSGKGSSARVRETRNILIWDRYRQRLIPGYLKFDVLMPSS